jgi:hypothetical protein
VQRTPRSLISVFYTGTTTFSFKLLLDHPHEAEWTPFQTHHYSENLVAPGIEMGTSGSVARNCDRQTTVVVLRYYSDCIETKKVDSLRWALRPSTCSGNFSESC